MKCDNCGDFVDVIFFAKRAKSNVFEDETWCAKCLVMQSGIKFEGAIRV